jgi:hypothetical protein
MSLAYKVEELLALRDSVSESAVSIDRFADEDVIKGQCPPFTLTVRFTSPACRRLISSPLSVVGTLLLLNQLTEHVLRPSASASANLASRSSGRSLRPPVAQPLAPAASQKRPSPTPSIKRGKAEKLLKEHGSPPGMRVTAGGRVVPSDLPPLGTSRFPDNTFKPSTLRVTPGNVMSSQTLPSNNTAARIEVVGGQPVIFIGDRMFALPAVTPNQASTSMDSLTKQPSDPPALSTQGSVSGLSFGPPRTSSTSPFAGLDLATLKAQQALKKQELRTVEQTEVLQASHQTEAWRASMIEKKRCLIVELDALRKSITALENDNTTNTHNNSFLGPIGTVPGSASLPTFVPQMQQPAPQPMYPFPAANPYTPMMMYPPPYSAFPSFPPAEPTPFAAPPTTNAPHSPGSATRRSRAIEIKPPQEGTFKQTLNPKSPTYEPLPKADPARSAVPPTPSPPKRSPWHFQEEPQSVKVERALSQKPSFSSIDTTDFFPTNTHEHSSTRLAPGASEPKQTANEVLPTTPEKHWPASPWNEGHSGRSRKNEPASKLTSWPEAFGKQRSSSSLRQNAAGQTSSALLEKAPIMGTYDPNSASSHNAHTQSDSEQRNGAEENWPFSRKAVAHVPSTYQEGYQAGYDHVGMPASPEVLQGYIQGLLHFLSDESKKDRLEAAVRNTYIHGIDTRTPSLRGLVAGSMPHDSAVSMTFNRNASGGADYENLRSSRETLPASIQRESAYSPQGSVKGVQGSYALFNEATQTSRRRNVSSMQYPGSAGLFPHKMVAGREPVFSSNENETRKLLQDKGTAACTDTSFTNGSFARQFSGAQLQNRNYGTPLSNQRFYPDPKKLSPDDFGKDSAPGIRPFADHRLSGLDGAMDDLADVVLETHVNDSRNFAAERSTATPVAAEAEVEEATASCFKSSNSKGKQKASVSPSKPTGTGRDTSTSSPNPPSSPKKSGEHSPAKAKLEQVTNKFRRTRKDDPRTMSPEDKLKRSDTWRQRFRVIKKTELEEIEEHRRNTRT